MLNDSSLLLSLPQEIFELVVHHYVNVAGVREAALVRPTCKSFATAIHHNIIAKQPRESFQRGRGKKCVQQHLAMILACRVNAAHGLSSPLLNVINGAVTAFQNIEGVTRYHGASRQHMISSITAVVAKHWDGARRLILDPPTTKSQLPRSEPLEVKDHISIHLHLAVLLQRCDLVMGLLHQGASIWKQVNGLSDVLSLAADGPINILFWLLEFDLRKHRGDPCDPPVPERSKALFNAIKTTLESGRPRLAAYLLRCHSGLFGKPCPSYYHRVLKLAVTSKALTFIDQVLSKELNGKDRRAPLTVAIVHALESKDLNSANWLFNRYDRHQASPTAADCRKLFVAAMNHDLASFVTTLLQTDRSESKDSAYREAVLRTFDYGKIVADDILRVCLHTQILKVEEPYRLYNKGKARILLYWAVGKNNIQLTSTLLEMSTSLTFGMWGPEDAAFRKAIKKNNVDMVKLLLDKGFDPEGETWDPHKKSSYEIARPGSAVAKVVREAILAKKALEGDDYFIPERFVWNEALQQDELRAYSLTHDEVEN